MDLIIRDLQDSINGKVSTNEPLAKHTTIKIGGPADIFIEPKDIESIKRAIDIFNKNKIKWRAIGRGSNLLVSDKGIEGAVIKLGAGLDHLVVDGTNITVGAGYSVVKLAMVISKKGLSGFEFSSGIPGSIGGAVYMNAGAHGSDISKILKRAHILFEDGTFEWLTNDEMEFSYRTSVLQNKKPGICIEAEFELNAGSRDEIVSVMQKNKDYRRETQPWNLPCAGSIFRNPLPNYAGQLIEKTGLKGYSIRGAKISDMHGNFIVNTGEAKAQDVLDLINYVKEKIANLHGIEMETEVEIVGRK
ncbi:UDP-N-acetylmuramate dehydrogenase [Fredinandcohnia quinoae]|uniref:UDP-N-acetylenolpyruvoylglucosamine reductase n=1 Tax=Fredinandcohnia quinoae TaxID=2918902 RepID=A0AAW5DU19_9BACI|nr:UDP-N-acetylmuramate dehydrogenase [Fredinandcohnia sp. SECRCQ15]MCH1623873.1 UDP-N-acetylmuramate dehydrogenase [Fredinandcohnia sp. SECRCQ15]